MEEDIDQLMKKVQRLEIKARRLSRESFSGEYHASFKGQGLDFEDFREYQHGDETRFIDWNVTARMNSPFVRTFREERELTVMIAVDISGSTQFGSQEYSKREISAEIAAVIAFSAKHNGDKVGLLLFSNQKEIYIPANKGTRHTLRMIREVLATEATSPATSLSAACEFLTKTVRKKALVFLLSDFIDHDYQKKLGTLSKLHDLIAIRVYDPAEETLPNIGRVTLADPESGHQTTINTSNSNVRMAHEKLTQRQTEGIKKTFQKYKIDHADTPTDTDYLPALHQLFKNRAGKHS